MYNNKEELLKAVYREFDDKTDIADSVSEEDFIEIAKYALRSYSLVPTSVILE